MIDNEVWGPKRHCHIYATHEIHRPTNSVPFYGNLPEMKAKAREILREQGDGWTVKVLVCEHGYDDVLYCERWVDHSDE